MKSFNVITEDINRRAFAPYDVIPYFVNRYKGLRKNENKPSNFDEFKEFVKKWSMYQYWARCEYEIILSGWPPASDPHSDDKKIDVHWQIMMNIDIIAEIVMDECLKGKKNKD